MVPYPGSRSDTTSLRSLGPSRQKARPLQARAIAVAVAARRPAA